MHAQLSHFDVRMVARLDKRRKLSASISLYMSLLRDNARNYSPIQLFRISNKYASYSQEHSLGQLLVMRMSYDKNMPHLPPRRVSPATVFVISLTLQLRYRITTLRHDARSFYAAYDGVMPVDTALEQRHYFPIRRASCRTIPMVRRITWARWPARP